MTPRVREILSWYGADNPGVLTNLARMMNHGKLAGTGKLVILPVDQGFEHGQASVTAWAGLFLQAMTGSGKTTTEISYPLALHKLKLCLPCCFDEDATHVTAGTAATRARARA